MNTAMFLSKPPFNDPRVMQEKMALEEAGHSIEIRFMNRNFPEALVKLVLPFFWRNQIIDLSLLYDTPSARSEAPQILHCHDLDTLPIGVRLKQKYPYTKLVFDFHDFPKYGESLIEAWGRVADAIITVSEPMQGYLSSLGLNSTVIHNYKSVSPDDYKPQPEHQNLRVGYFGGLYNLYGLRFLPTVCHAMPDVQFVVGGSGPLARSLGRTYARNLYFFGRMNLKEVQEQQAECDVLLAMLNPRSRNGSIGMPHKMFEAMRVGRPVITTVGTYSGKFAAREGFGVIAPFSSEGLVDALSWLLEDQGRVEQMGRRGHQAALTKYNWNDEKRKLIEVYRRFS